MNCNKCGAPLEEGVTTCPACGAVLDAEPPVEAAAEPIVEPVTPFVEAAPVVEKPDGNMKIFAILGYLFYILFLIPMFISKESKWAMSHANNALVLLIAGLIAGIVGEIPVIGFLGTILSIATFVLAILGIVAAAKEQDGTTVPIIGTIKILK